MELDAGLPPLLIECGDAECLHDQVGALVQRAEAVEGMDVEFHACEGMVHVFPLFYPFCKAESDPVQAFKRMAQFGDRVWMWGTRGRVVYSVVHTLRDGSCAIRL